MITEYSSLWAAWSQEQTGALADARGSFAARSQQLRHQRCQLGLCPGSVVAAFGDRVDHRRMGIHTETAAAAGEAKKTTNAGTNSGGGASSPAPGGM